MYRLNGPLPTIPSTDELTDCVERWLRTKSPRSLPTAESLCYVEFFVVIDGSGRVNVAKRVSATLDRGEALSKPAIISVDDDPQVLAAVSRDLRQHYGESYRIVRASSGQRGSETLSELQGRGDAVAAFVVDQRMPEMSGTEFLTQRRGPVPGCQEGVAHCLRRHGCGDRRHQRSGTGPLPDEALGSPGGAPLPGAG